MSVLLQRILHPTPEPDRTDTSLRYTDILFGFVIRELFLRLQHSPDLTWPLRLQLVAATSLVLGSWIGFRRSANRPAYVVKFFNLPFSRFLLDQLMLILYFRVATLVPEVKDQAKTTTPSGDVLASATTSLIVWIFVLYILWDLLGIWTANATDSLGKPRYTKVTFDPAQGRNIKGEEKQKADWVGTCITFSFLVMFLCLRLTVDCLIPCATFVVITLLLLLYRWVKETRTTWQSHPPPSPAASAPAIAA
jgi:hypothetical protein